MKTEQYRFLFEAIRIFSSSLDIAVSSHRLLRHLSTFIPVDFLTFVVYEPELKTARQVVRTTLAESIWEDRLFNLPDEIASKAESVDLENPVILEQLFKGQEDLLKEIEMGVENVLPFSIDAPRSTMGLPLTIEGKWIGNLSCTAQGENRYQTEKLDLLTPLQEPLALVLTNALRYQEVLKLQELLAEDNRYLRKELRHKVGEEIIGRNFGLKQVMEMVWQAAPMESPILLTGETGTGKELIANAIHYGSPRKDGPFIKMNCGAIPESLVDSEMFGHEKGAFTGAMEQKKGRFERAHGGTLFLDEVGELPLTSQVKLLRVLQQKEIERVGGTETIKLDIRIIAATHRSLENMVIDGTFREDLLYRIAVFPIMIPPLRQRRMDIPELVDYFLQKKVREMKVWKKLHLEPGTMEKLIEYEWKGNVRELENVIERAIIRSNDGILRMGDYLPRVKSPSNTELSAPTPDPGHALTLDDVQRYHIEQMLQRTKGKIAGPGGCAELLKISPSTLRSKMAKLGIPFKKNQR